MCVCVCGMYTPDCELEQCSSLANHACIMILLWFEYHIWVHTLGIVNHVCILMSILVYVLCAMRIWEYSLGISDFSRTHHLQTMNAS